MRAHYRILRGGTLIDGTGRRPIGDSALVKRWRRIEGVGARGEVKIPEGGEVLDTTGRTIHPGIIGAHLHFWGIKNSDALRWYLEPTRGHFGLSDRRNFWRIYEGGAEAHRLDPGLKLARWKEPEN